MEAVQRLCPLSMLLDRGRLVAYGPTKTVIERYLRQFLTHASPREWIDLSALRRGGTGEARFAAAKFTSFNETAGCHAYSEGPLEFTLAIESDNSRVISSMAVSFETASGIKLIDADIVSIGGAVRLHAGRNVVRFSIRELHLNPGTYGVGFWLGPPAGSALDYIPAAFQLEVVQTSSPGFGVLPSTAGPVPCSFTVSQDS